MNWSRSRTVRTEITAGRLTHLSQVPAPMAAAAMTKPVIMKIAPFPVRKKHFRVLWYDS